MSISANEDREQSKNASMEKSDLMTIEFLRARLLAERSVSKTARQRADELANRVAELKEQLKYAYIQREKAEKATSDILVILKNHGMGDVLEEFDSSTDQEEDSQDFKAHNGPLSVEETSTNVRNSEKETYSSSEIESSPSTGRSLSWKSTRESQRSFEKKTFIDPIRRRASFSSNSSSSRRVGKSCRKIKRKDTRSVEELPNDGNERTTYSKDSSNNSDGETVASAERLILGRSSGTQKGNDRYFEKDEDMESALLHQAELIGRYEEEEKAQRQWEEKFRENNSCTQDSCDPGNHSDVTEERYETKSAQQSYDQETKQGPADLRANEEPETSELSPSLADAEKGSLKAPDSSPPDFSFPKSLKSLEDSGRSNEPSKQTPANTSPSYDSKMTPLSSRSDLAVVPQETPNNLGSVLEALQRAKSSLSEKLSGSPRAAGGTSCRVAGPSNTKTDKLDSFQIPFGTPGLFRLPTDFQYEATARPQPSFANLSNELAAADRFLTEPRSALSATLTREMRPHSQPYSNPIVHDSYPFLPDITLHIPPNEEELSRNFPSSEKGLPLVMRLSSYDPHYAPNMYR